MGPWGPIRIHGSPWGPWVPWVPWAHRARADGRPAAAAAAATGGGRQAAGGRRQVAGGRRQAAGGRRQAAGGRRQAAGGRPALQLHLVPYVVGTFFKTQANTFVWDAHISNLWQVLAAGVIQGS